MVINGEPRGDPGQLAEHVQKDENEKVWIIGSQGLAAQDIEGAFFEMDALGAELRTDRTLYHMQINPEPGKDRAMTEDEVKFAVDLALSKVDLARQPYLVIGHEKFGEDGILRRHFHVVAARTDLEHNRAIRCDHNYRKHEEAAREIERALGHNRIQGAHAERFGIERPERAPTRAEQQQAKSGAVPAKEAKALGAEIWAATDSGKAINAALDAHGWQLARGDKERKDGGAYFMAIDPSGHAHELRRMVPVKAASLYERMADIDAAMLPSVREASNHQRARAAEMEQRKAAIGRYDELRPASTKWDFSRTRDFADAGAARGAEQEQYARAAQGQGQDNTRASGPENGPEPQHYDRDSYNADWQDSVAAAAIKAAREAEREARRAEWIERHRPKTEIEQKILWTFSTEEFAASGDRARIDAKLKNAGFALGRVTADDLQALDNERQAEAIAHAADPSHQIRFIPPVELGELAAVDQHGGIHRLNQFHLEHIARRMEQAPSITELRTAFAGEREAAVKFQQEMIDIQLRRQEEAAHARELRTENFETERASARFDAMEIKGGIKATGREIDAAPMEAAEASREGVSLLARIGQIFLGLLGGWAMAPPKLTPEQAKQEARAEDEAAPIRAAAAQEAADWNRQEDDYEARRRSARQLEEAQLARILGNTSPAEAQRGVDAERGRERELRREE
jgi:hypothetical protein